jgi:hypothetical protein
MFKVLVEMGADKSEEGTAERGKVCLATGGWEGNGVHF